MLAGAARPKKTSSTHMSGLASGPVSPRPRHPSNPVHGCVRQAPGLWHSSLLSVCMMRSCPVDHLHCTESRMDIAVLLGALLRLSRGTPVSSSLLASRALRPTREPLILQLQETAKACSSLVTVEFHVVLTCGTTEGQAANARGDLSRAWAQDGARGLLKWRKRVTLHSVQYRKFTVGLSQSTKVRDPKESYVWSFAHSGVKAQ